MKPIIAIALFFSFAYAACGTSDPEQQFVLTIQRYDGSVNLIYELTDTSLTVTQIRYPKQTDSLVFHSRIEDHDSLLLISKLDVKAYDCKEQHALVANTVAFSLNKGVDQIVNPYVNHPKEVDMAVRIINSYLPEKFRLYFIDMQRAVDEFEKLNV